MILYVLAQEYRLFYRNIHSWIRYHYGPASFCEFDVSHGGNFERALKRGFKHKKDINSYLSLCKKCHMIYDKGRIHAKADLKSRVARSASREMPLKPVMIRMGVSHRNLIKKLSKKFKLGNAQVVRDAIEAYAKQKNV